MKVVVCTAGTKSLKWFRLDMMRAFIDAGCEVVAMGDEPEGRWAGYFEEREIRYRSFFVERNGTNPVKDLRTLRDLERVFGEERPDKVFVYHAKANIYGAIAAKRAGVPEVYAMVGGLGSIFNAGGLKNRLLRRVLCAEYRYALKRVEKVFFQNSEDADLFERLGVVDRSRVVMVRGSGVNVDHFARKPLPGKPSFLFVGRLVKGKGIREYLEAARIVKRTHPEASFAVVGPFDTNPTSMTPEELRTYVDDGTVVYHGEQEDVRPFLEACSVFVLPSYYGEGTPKAALEAMATGRPLIVADAVGCREVVERDVNGVLVEPRSTTELAVAMQALVENSEKVRTMACASRAMAKEVFDVRRVNRTICDEMGISREAMAGC